MRGFPEALTCPCVLDLNAALCPPLAAEGKLDTLKPPGLRLQSKLDTLKPPGLLLGRKDVATLEVLKWLAADPLAPPQLRRKSDKMLTTVLDSFIASMATCQETSLNDGAEQKKHDGDQGAPVSHASARLLVQAVTSPEQPLKGRERKKERKERVLKKASQKPACLPGQSMSFSELPLASQTSRLRPRVPGQVATCPDLPSASEVTSCSRTRACSVWSRVLSGKPVSCVEAVWAKCEECLSLVIQAGADVNKKFPTDDDYVPLIEAMRIGDETVRRSIVKTLLRAGADAETVHYGCMSPLCYAISTHRVDEMEDLLAHGAKANVDLLVQAVRTRSLDCVRILLRAGADVNGVDAVGSSPLGQSLVNEKMLGSDPTVQQIHQELLNAGASVTKCR
jgi:hypothetical protein